MNTHPGILGTKLGCTQIFNTDGSVTRVTVIEAGPCTIVRKRTVELDGYSALQLAFGEKREKLISKPEKGHLLKAGIEPRKETRKGREVTLFPRELRELRLSAEEVAKYEVGQTISVADVLKEGQFVDVCGTSRGRGFSGVMRRHNFAGFTRTHGTHEYKRHGGSIGTNMTPGRTMPGKKMPGQEGNKRCTTLNLKVARVIPEQNLVLIDGPVPGSRNMTVVVRGAIKNGRHA
jgi:large subunit ribosomal protein L3